MSEKRSGRERLQKDDLASGAAENAACVPAIGGKRRDSSKEGAWEPAHSEALARPTSTRGLLPRKS